MSQSELAGRFHDMFRLGGIERAGHAGLDVAEGAGAGAGVTHDHEGRVFLLPALANVRATGLFAHGVQAVVTHNFLGSEIALRDGSLHANPVGLFQNRRIRPVRLFRVTRARVVHQIENDCHGFYLRLRRDRCKAARAAENPGIS